MLPPPSSTPTAPSASSVLSGLDDYALSFLPSHLAAAGQRADLRQLLLLRESDHSNAWFARSPSLAVYVTHLADAMSLARTDLRLDDGVLYALIGDAVRRGAAVQPELLVSFVDHGLLQLDRALDMCAAAPTPSLRIISAARLLPRLTGRQRDNLFDETLASITVRARNRTSIGRNLSEELPLSAAEHVQVIRELAQLPGLSQRQIDQLRAVAPQTTSIYAAIEAQCAVAQLLAQHARAALLTELWAEANSMHRFRGRGEAGVLVVCAADGELQDRFAGMALTNLLDVLADSQERVSFHDWTPYDDGSTFGSSVLWRLRSFAAPLRVLAMTLSRSHLAAAMSAIEPLRDSDGGLSLIALLPAVGRYSPATALAIADRCGTLSILALADVLAAGVEAPGIDPDRLVVLAGSDELPERRALTLLALTPILRPQRQEEILTDLLLTAEDSDRARSFRLGLIREVSPLIANLPPELREPLLRACRKPDRLTRTRYESDALMKPLANLWPRDLLENEFAQTRAIGLSEQETTLMRRTPIAPPPMDLPRLARATVHAALADTAEDSEAQRAELLMLLAPVLEKEDRPRALEAIAAITAAHLRIAPQARLLAAADPPAESEILDLIRALQEVAGGLDRLDDVIDDLVATSSFAPTPTVLDALGNLVGSSGAGDLAALMPFVVALGGPEVQHASDDAVSALAHWHGAGQVARDEAPESTLFKVKRLRLDPLSAGFRLLSRFCGAGDWASAEAVVGLLIALDAGTDRLDAGVRDAVQMMGEVQTPAGHQFALTLLGATSSRATRQALLALLLRSAARNDSDEVNRIVAQPEFVWRPDDASDLNALSAALALIDAHLAMGAIASAANALEILTQDSGPHRTALGRTITTGVEHLAAKLDAVTDPDDLAIGERAFQAVLSYVRSHQDDYSMQEAMGAVLRQRISTTLDCGRQPDPAWVANLESLADADDPSEVSLHSLAVAAVADAAIAAARASDACAALEFAHRAIARWSRRPITTEGRSIVSAMVIELLSDLPDSDVRDRALALRATVDAT